MAYVFRIPTGGRDDGHDGSTATLSGDTMVMDCRGCDLTPLPGSSECIGCMVGAMCRLGGADRVVLRTGRDTEISGRAGRVLKEVASLRRWSTPVDAPKGRCRGCDVSRQEIMGQAWSRFPDGVHTDLRDLLSTGVPDREGCDRCVASTSRALDQMEEGLEGIAASMRNGRAAR